MIPVQLDTFGVQLEAPIWLWAAGGMLILGILFLYWGRKKQP